MQGWLAVRLQRKLSRCHERRIAVGESRELLDAGFEEYGPLPFTIYARPSFQGASTDGLKDWFERSSYPIQFARTIVSGLRGIIKRRVHQRESIMDVP